MVLLKILFFASLFVILYTYFGYPFVILLLAQIMPQRHEYEQDMFSVTIIIPAYNEETCIEKKLENTLSLDYPREKFQILVTADGSSDRTPEIVEGFKSRGVELNYIPDRNGKMAAIVRAMEFSRGDIVVFSDANNMYDIQAVRNLILPFSDPTVGATTGAKLIIEDGRDLSSAEGLYWKYESLIKKSESTIDSCVSSVGEILAVRKSIFIAPEQKIINDDHYIILDVLRRGYRVIYTPDARSYEYVSLTANDEVERRIRMNAGLYQTIALSARLLPFKRPLLIWQVISHKFLRGVIPFALLIVFLSNFLLLFMARQEAGLTVFSPINFFGIFFYLQLFFYILAFVGNAITLNGWVGKVFYLPVFLLNSNMATMMGFFSYLTNKQSHIWKRVNRK